MFTHPLDRRRNDGTSVCQEREKKGEEMNQESTAAGCLLLPTPYSLPSPDNGKGGGKKSKGKYSKSQENSENFDCSKSWWTEERCGRIKNFLSSSNGSCALACLLESFQVVLCKSARVLPPTDVPYFPAVVFR